MNLLFKLSGFSLIFSASVLWVNGLWLLDKTSEKSVVFVNIFASFIILSISIFSIFSNDANVTSINTGAMTLLFSFTYFWLAFNIMQGVDNMVGLGWFSLLASITLLTTFIMPINSVSSFWHTWNNFNWIIWSILFLLFFLMLTLQIKINKLIGYYSIFAALATAFVPGFLVLMTNIK